MTTRPLVLAAEDVMLFFFSTLVEAGVEGGGGGGGGGEVEVAEVTVADSGVETLRVDDN